jgi:hypothetical protein
MFINPKINNGTNRYRILLGNGNLKIKINKSKISGM